MDTILTVLMIILHSVTSTNHRPNIQAHDTRPNACRTYNVGGYDMTDGMPCGIVLDDRRNDSKEITQNNDTVPSNETVIVVMDNPTNDTPQIDAPVQNDDKNEHSNNGNHYGNDRPDNNPNDDKNKHDGCNQDCTGHDNPTNEHKKKEK